MDLALFPLGNIYPEGKDYIYQLTKVRQCYQQTYTYQVDRDARTKNPPDRKRLVQDRFELNYK